MRLTFPLLFRSMGITVVLSRTFINDGDGGTSITYWSFYSSDMYSCLACLTNPQHSTALFPCETYPTQRPPITTGLVPGALGSGCHRDAIL